MITSRSPFSLADSYKLSHWVQYPEDVQMVYSNLTPRKSRDPRFKRFVFFGLRPFLFKLKKVFEENFFDLTVGQAVQDYIWLHTEFFLSAPSEEQIDCVTSLHKLGYLPLEIKALPEGSSVPHGIPVLTIQNTVPGFHWLTNFVESWMSSEIWHPCTSATMARKYKETFVKYANLTSVHPSFTDFQGHDFSFRGLCGLEAAKLSGAAHLTSFIGTDNIPGYFLIKEYYNLKNDQYAIKLLGTSVPATEHSVMQSDGAEGELDTYRRLITKTYPTGTISIVSDTYDLWKVVTEYLPALKKEIMARDGKVVIRPDSNPKTPVEIICGDPEAKEGSPENLGLARCLYNTFGGRLNGKGYIDLDEHIGMIYGDSITLDAQEKILEGLKRLGFASTNIVLGIGSYTYQNATRDTHGIAIKATAVGLKDGTIKPIFKDPVTDTYGKKSARGILSVVIEQGDYKLIEECESDKDSLLKSVFKNGLISDGPNFAQIRLRLDNEPVG